MDTKSLEHFKDWSNYLLVTTVAAQGIEIHQPVMMSPFILSIAVSIVLGVFTLALDTTHRRAGAGQAINLLCRSNVQFSSSA